MSRKGEKKRWDYLEQEGHSSTVHRTPVLCPILIKFPPFCHQWTYLHLSPKHRTLEQQAHKNGSALITRKVYVSVNEFLLYWSDQLAHSNWRSRFFQETNDQPVDTESLNYLNLLLSTVPFDNSQFPLFFSILVQSLFLLKTEFKPCLFLSRCYLMAQTLSVSPSKTVYFPFVLRCSHMSQGPFRWGTHLLGLGASLTGIAFQHQSSHIITLLLSWHLFYCKGLSLLEKPPNSLIAVY